MTAPRLKSAELRREREPAWIELERLVRTAETEGIAALLPSELRRLPVLYRVALSSLSVARAISLDRRLLAYLESLGARAYLVVYGTKRPMRETVAGLLGTRLPQAVRSVAPHLALALALIVLGTLTGMRLTLEDPGRFYSFVSPEYAQGRGPASSTEELLSVLNDTGGGAADVLTAFAMFLFTHNAKIGMLAFALGFAAGVPVLFLLFQNGLLLGAFAALYHERGLSLEFWAWVLPHGVTEFLAIALCGAAGFLLGQSVLFPGSATRLQNLAHNGRRAGVVVLGAVLLFWLAGLIEGIFRQSVHDLAVRYSVAALSGACWLLYFTRAGRQRP
jgi:uncharacterized membrane protein SpoIIM required for sporulation